MSGVGVAKAAATGYQISGPLLGKLVTKHRRRDDHLSRKYEDERTLFLKELNMEESADVGARMCNYFITTSIPYSTSLSPRMKEVQCGPEAAPGAVPRVSPNAARSHALL